MPWMKEEFDDAVEKGILVPAESLRLTDNEEDDYKKGFVYEKTPEILTPGHTVMMTKVRIEKFKFERLVGIYLMVRNIIKTYAEENT